MTEAKFDDVIHAPNRLSITALLAGVQGAEFSFVRDEVGVSDSVLSKQMSILEEAGYVQVKKGYVGKRPRTWLLLTGAGRLAFDGHVAALQALVARANQSAPTGGSQPPPD